MGKGTILGYFPEGVKMHVENLKSVNSCIKRPIYLVDMCIKKRKEAAL